MALTESYKFKKGARVRYTGNGSTVSKGMIGTVTEDDDAPYVRWDNFFKGTAEDKRIWAVSQDDLELLVEPSVEAFKIGQRVRVNDLFSIYHGDEGFVVEGNYATHLCVRADDGGKRYFRPDQLTSIEQAPASPPKPECYVLAWVYNSDNGESFSLVSGERFQTKEEADRDAEGLVRVDPGDTVAVFKLVSKHSSTVTVTSEDV